MSNKFIFLIGIVFIFSFFQSCNVVYIDENKVSTNHILAYNKYENISLVKLVNDTIEANDYCYFLDHIDSTSNFKTTVFLQKELKAMNGETAKPKNP